MSAICSIAYLLDVSLGLITRQSRGELLLVRLSALLGGQGLCQSLLQLLDPVLVVLLQWDLLARLHQLQPSKTKGEKRRRSQQG